MTISVVIPVLHEQERINACIARLQYLAHDTEVIVVDGDPAASTLAVITDTNVIRLSAPAGRGSQLAAGAAAARGDLLLLLHVDTQLPDHAFAYIVRAVADGAAWGAFRLGIDASPLPYRIIEWAVDLRCRVFKLPYGDQAMFVTRAALDQVGGIPAIPLMEDVALVQRLNRAGMKMAMLPEKVLTSARRWQNDGIIRRTLLNWWLLIQYLAGADPGRLAGKYP